MFKSYIMKAGIQSALIKAGFDQKELADIAPGVQRLIEQGFTQDVIIQTIIELKYEAHILSFDERIRMRLVKLARQRANN